MYSNYLEDTFLYLERKKIYKIVNYKKINFNQRKKVLKFFEELAFNKRSKQDLRYINLSLKFEPIFKKKNFNYYQIRKILNG